ncbi:type VI secretion system baseplate subunit TssG [Fodinicurvata sp. EGI_FJ10296]|uniref:type VI secretion system baseplate subunit TssG n=1 Tax=Fodinicurvata sp. EGI_FJ10296 TaxID=3231908 RepID=UPI0034557906
MATESRRTATSLIAQLERDPDRFSFFQAVRVLEWAAARDSAAARNAARHPVGGDADPASEAVRFRSTVSLIHPAAEVTSVVPAKDGKPPELTVSFMGLVGPVGAMPEHYTEQLIEAIRAKNTAFRDFLDMLHHRTVSLFYRSWAKHRLPIAHERRYAAEDRSIAATGDLFGLALSSLVGLSTPGHAGRLAFGDDLALHYSGHLSNRRRSAVGLQAMVADLLGRPVEIRQFRGAWLEMEEDSRTRLPSVMAPMGQHARLGVDAIIGARAWDVQAGFTIRVGPLGLDGFRDLMPGQPMLRKLADLVRFAVGPSQAFSIQPVLKADAVPMCRLISNKETGPRLGWNTWILGETGSGAASSDRDDAVFTMADFHQILPPDPDPDPDIAPDIEPGDVDPGTPGDGDQSDARTETLVSEES